MKVTADTLTAKQIRDERSMTSDDVVRFHCDMANLGWTRDRMSSRSAIAAAINARHGAKP